MGDWWLLVGGIMLFGLGLMCQLRPDLIWRLYSMEPRWRRDNPTQTANWKLKVKRQGYVFMVLGVVFTVLGVLIGH